MRWLSEPNEGEDILPKSPHLRQKLMDFASLITLELDFSEEDVAFADRTALNLLLEELQSKIKSLLDSFQYGSVIKKGRSCGHSRKAECWQIFTTQCLVERAASHCFRYSMVLPEDTIEDTLTFCQESNSGLLIPQGFAKPKIRSRQWGVARAKEKVAQAKIMLYLYDPNDTNISEIITALNEFKRKDLIIVLVENKIDLIGDLKGTSLISELKKQSSHFSYDALCGVFNF